MFAVSPVSSSPRSATPYRFADACLHLQREPWRLYDVLGLGPVPASLFVVLHPFLSAVSSLHLLFVYSTHSLIITDTAGAESLPQLCIPFAFRRAYILFLPPFSLYRLVPLYPLGVQMSSLL